jgi:hypothetical protein
LAGLPEGHHPLDPGEDAGEQGHQQGVQRRRRPVQGSVVFGHRTPSGEAGAARGMGWGHI